MRIYFTRGFWDARVYSENRAYSLLQSLSNAGVASDEIVHIFHQRFSVELKYKGGKLVLDEHAASAFREKFSEIRKYTRRFLSSGLSYAKFCELERRQISTRTSPSEIRSYTKKRRRRVRKVPRVGSDNQQAYMAGAVIFGLLGIIFWPLQILAGICLFLFIFVGLFKFDLFEDGKEVEGFGVLDGLPVGLAIPVVVIAIILFAVAMGNK